MEHLINVLESSLGTFSIISYVVVFGAGVLTSFTPCVYPMLPVTVAFVGGKSGGSKAKAALLSMCYILGIAVMYSFLGALASFTGTFFGRISTSPWLQFIVANVFILMGLNMLDVWQMPSFSFAHRFRAAQSSKFDMLGAFAFGLASGSVFAPCTAPVLGVLLAFVASRQSVVYGISMLFVFAVGMGTLLFCAGTFAGFVTSLPKAGAWTEKIKKGFGWIMIAAGEYFLINTGKFL